jgi:hypothetical protein
MTTVWKRVEVDGFAHDITVTQTDDPAYGLSFTEHKSTPTIFSAACYICVDPEFAQMGLPLCWACAHCGGHVAADDDTCDDCGQCGYAEVQGPGE